MTGRAEGPTRWERVFDSAEYGVRFMQRERFVRRWLADQAHHDGAAFAFSALAAARDRRLAEAARG